MRDLGPSETELERARTNLLASQVHERETMQGQAQKYGYFELLAGGLDAEQQYLDRVRRATQADLQRVAQQYLTPERATVVALTRARTRQRLGDRGGAARRARARRRRRGGAARRDRAARRHPRVHAARTACAWW